MIQVRHPDLPIKVPRKWRGGYLSAVIDMGQRQRQLVVRVEIGSGGGGGVESVFTEW
jgi:hypothetical protein